MRPRTYAALDAPAARCPGVLELGVSRRLTTTMLQATATIWAGALLLCGFAILFGAGGWLPVSLESPVRTALGVTMLLAAQVVFMCLVADRAFPLADRRFVVWTEIPACSALGVSVVWVVWRVVSSATGGDS